MTIDKVEQDIIKVASQFSFVVRSDVIDKTDNTIKVRLKITSECFVQVYQNIEKDVVNFVLIYNRFRIFGRDCDGGSWHRHPHSNPEAHDFSDEGSHPVTLEEFLQEACEIVYDIGLL